ncbi:MAG: ABC transporter permease [Alphaproteobacteria bacterium]|nr:ABC transporter permease [Alphaproteobacteria bacterium]
MTRILAVARRRLLHSIPVVAIVVLGVFALLEAAPGDAVDAYLVIGGGDAEMIQRLRQEWGLDRSFLARLGAYLTALAHLDLGWSVAFARPVSAVLFERLPNTLMMMAAAICFSFSAGTLLGIAAGARPGSLRDRILSLVSLGLYAMPSFWLGLMLLVGFAVKLAWFPLGGIESVGMGKTGLARALDIARHLVLPVLSLGLIYLALYLRLMRTGMIEAWRSDYIRTARAKGLTPRRIAFRHAARNALLPVVTMLGLQAGALLSGSVVVESVFAIPGMGRLAFEAVTQRDVPLLLGVFLISTLMVILANLFVDLLYARLDPRVAAEG